MPSGQEEEGASPASATRNIPKIVIINANGTESRNDSSLGGNGATTPQNTVQAQVFPVERAISTPSIAARNPAFVLPPLRPSRAPVKRAREEDDHAEAAMGRKKASVATRGNNRHRGWYAIGDSDTNDGAPRPAVAEPEFKPEPTVRVSRRSRRITLSASDGDGGEPTPSATEPEPEPAPAVPQRSLRIVIKKDGNGDGRYRAAVAELAGSEPAVTGDSSGGLIPSPPATPTASNTLAKVVDCLALFPVGEVAYGAELFEMPLPDLQIDNADVVTSPYDRGQVGVIKEFAEGLRAKRFGIDWEKVTETPTWVIPGNLVTVKHAQWEGFLEGLACKAGQYLGFGKTKLNTRLQGLYLWEKGSMWRDYHSELHYPRRVGNLLIILNRGYKGGEIAVGCGESEVYFDPASASQDQFFIASHNKAKHDNLPFTEGHRIGLVYDLRVNTTANQPAAFNAHTLADKTAKAERVLANHIARWADEIETGQRANHPLLFGLDRTYMLPELSLRVLALEDRAKVLAVQKMQRDAYGKGGYRLRAYLVDVMAKAMASYHATGGVQRWVRYTVDRAAGLEGEEEPDVAVRLRVDEKCLVQQMGKFDFALEPERDEGGEMIVARRGRTCLMLLLEREDSEGVV